MNEPEKKVYIDNGPSGFNQYFVITLHTQTTYFLITL